MRAVILGDVALIVMTIAWIKASRDEIKSVRKRPELLTEGGSNLSLKHIWSVVAIAFPLGVSLGCGLLRICRGSKASELN